jgi:hypothetical protein
MGGVVPAGRKLGGAAVEDDPAADEDHTLDEALDRAELVRDVEDRHAELLMEFPEKGGENLLRVDVDSRGWLVEDEEIRFPGERLRDVSALLLSPRKPLDRATRQLAQSNSVDRAGNHVSVAAAEWSEKPATRNPSRGNDLPHGGRSVDPELRSLGEVGDPKALVEIVRGLAEEARLAG